MTEPIHDPFEYFFGCKRFALWHRFFLPSSFRAIDIDLIGRDHDRLVYVIESTTSQAGVKNCSITKSVAEDIGARAYVVQIPKMERPPDDMPWRDVADLVMHSEPPDRLTMHRVFPEPAEKWDTTWNGLGRRLNRCRTAGGK